MGATDASRARKPDGIISFKCKCGKQYAIKDTFAGKTATCKHCGATLVVPLHASEDTGAVPEVKMKMQLVIVAGIAIIVLILLGGGFYAYYTLRQDAHRSNLALYNACLMEAKDSIEKGKISGAIDKLQEAVALPDYVIKDDAASLLKELQKVELSPKQVLKHMSDDDFETLRSTGNLPPSYKLSSAPLNAIFLEKLFGAKDAEASRRKTAHDEAERVAKADAERHAQVEANRKEREKSELQDVSKRAFAWGRICGMRWMREYAGPDEQPSREEVAQAMDEGYALIFTNEPNPPEGIREAYRKSFENGTSSGFVIAKINPGAVDAAIAVETAILNSPHPE
jgi:hypothetical protein